jgi:hypothetical protein
MLTPTIAAIAVYVAWQQSRIANAKFRLDYFERRFPIYEAAITLAAKKARATLIDEWTLSQKARVRLFFGTD